MLMHKSESGTGCWANKANCSPRCSPTISRVRTPEVPSMQPYVASLLWRCSQLAAVEVSSKLSTAPMTEPRELRMGAACRRTATRWPSLWRRLTIEPEDFLTQTACDALGGGVPEHDFAVSVDEIDAGRQSVKDRTQDFRIVNANHWCERLWAHRQRVIAPLVPYGWSDSLRNGVVFCSTRGRGKSWAPDLERAVPI